PRGPGGVRGRAQRDARDAGDHASPAERRLLRPGLARPGAQRRVPVNSPFSSGRWSNVQAPRITPSAPTSPWNQAVPVAPTAVVAESRHFQVTWVPAITPEAGPSAFGPLQVPLSVRSPWVNWQSGAAWATRVP